MGAATVQHRIAAEHNRWQNETEANRAKLEVELTAAVAGGNTNPQAGLQEVMKKRRHACEEEPAPVEKTREMDSTAVRKKKQAFSWSKAAC